MFKDFNKSGETIRLLDIYCLIYLTFFRQCHFSLPATSLGHGPSSHTPVNLSLQPRSDCKPLKLLLNNYCDCARYL